jgi:hypothetical protein
MHHLTEILKRLIAARVEFSLIGGQASRHYGVTLVTEDLDICARFTPANLRRIEGALNDLHPRHRLTPQKLPLELTDELCGRLKNLYLITDLGVLDCLGSVTGVGDFDAVVEQSEFKEFPFGGCHVLKIEALIRAKATLGRPHDLIAVTQLRAIQERLAQQQTGR